MLKHFWGAAGVLAVAGATLLMSPQTSEAQTIYKGYGWGWGSPAYWGSYTSPYYNTGYAYPYYTGYAYPAYTYAYPAYTYAYPAYTYAYPAYTYASPSYTYTYPVNYAGFLDYPSTTTYAYVPDYSPYIATAYPAASSVQLAKAAAPNAVHMMVVVPRADAKVFFNGQPTYQTGYERTFFTEMAPATTGVYHIKVRWTENGRVHTETRNVDVHPGSWEVVDFNQTLGSVRVTPARPVRSVQHNPQVLPPQTSNVDLEQPTEERGTVNNRNNNRPNPQP